jgi:hypothetical protein
MEDAAGVPDRHVLLRRNLHQVGVDLVLVLETLDHRVGDPLRLGRALIAKSKDHS